MTSSSLSLIDDIRGSIHALDADFHARTGASRALHDAARHVLPGGNTRSVLHYAPYPVYAQRGEGAELVDADGRRLLDFVGEFSAGLLGHSNALVLEAIRQSLTRGMVLAAPIEQEARMASLLVGRFPSVERVRFCNSGTEANLFALCTARAVTERPAILAFRQAYHGGVLTFGDAPSPMNVPFDVHLAHFNDAQDVWRVGGPVRDTLAAVIVEPMLGAGGNIAPLPGFLQALRDFCDQTGALLVFDEVKTSRSWASGLQGHFGVRPDLTTFGKYLGGGLPLGAFGGRADIMDRFDPARPDALKHAGTFNNNICSLSAGIAALSEVYTPARADSFSTQADQVRLRMQQVLHDAGVPAQASGLGSIFSLHFTRGTLRDPRDIPAHSRVLGELLHRFLFTQDILVCSRGDIYLSLPMTASDFSRLESALLAFADRYRPLLQRVPG